MKKALSLFAALIVTATLVTVATIPKVLGAAATPETTIKIDNFSFYPGTTTIAVGMTVRWVNQDDIPHTVVEDSKAFKSKALDTDEAFTYTFTKPGTYSYFCSLHPKMTAKVVVK